MPTRNADGLLVYYGGELREIAGGEFPSAGSIRILEWEVPATSFTTTAAPVYPGFVIIPRNSVIDSIEVQSETALTGTATGFDLGIQRLDGVTEYDYDGLVANMLIAAVNANGEKNVLSAGVGVAGALVGNETAYPGHLSIRSIGGTFTAGRLLVRLRIYVKDEDLLVNNW